MKNAIKIFIVALTTLAFGGTSFAQAKPAVPATRAVPSAPAVDKSEELSKAKTKVKAKVKKTVKKAADKVKDITDKKEGATIEKKTK